MVLKENSTGYFLLTSCQDVSENPQSEAYNSGVMVIIAGIGHGDMSLNPG